MAFSGLKIIPVSNWTLAPKGSAQVGIVGMDDKREITALITVSASGVVLPPQLIYKGTTTKCHPAGVNFPTGWDIWHTANHWSNESSMLRYIDNIIVPYMDESRRNLGLPSNHKGMCIFDVFAAHLCQSVKDKLKDNNLLYVTVPAGCTGELQPCDLTVNHYLKTEMKQKFNEYYSNYVAEELQTGNALDTPLSLQLTVLKPIHAGWIMDCFARLREQKELVISGFRQAGIVPVNDSDADTLPPSPSPNTDRPDIDTIDLTA